MTVSYPVEGDVVVSQVERMGSLTILLVEDNAGEVFLMQEALEVAGFPHVLHIVQDGDAAINFLCRSAAGQGPWPDLMVLDLNLPGKSGRQVLAEMQAAPELKVFKMGLPVAILTTSQYEAGIGLEFPQLRSTFAAKTPDFRRLVEIIGRFKEFAEQSA